MFISPMLLEKSDSPFDDDRYIFEPKIDGHRLELILQSGQIHLYTRHGNLVTRQYPELHKVPVNGSHDLILDGEVAYVNPDNGNIEFETLMERFQTSKESWIRAAALQKPVHFYVFDILQYKGKDLRALPLLQRKEILADVLTNTPHFSRMFYVEGSGSALFETIKARHLEGTVAKIKDSRYCSKRSPAWRKIINYQTAEVTISEFRKNQFGWIATHNGRNVGIIELAVPAAHKKAFAGVAKSLITGEDRDFVYVRPAIRAKVRFRNWTRSGMLRIPEFIDFIV